MYLSTEEMLGTEASDGDVKGVPAVVLAAAAAPILGRCHCCRPVSNLSVRLFPGGSGARLRVILIILVEVAVLHHAEAGGGAQVLAAPLVLLDGLVERPQLAQQGHVLLAQTHHLFPQKSQSSVEVGRLVCQEVVGVVPASAQVVLDHGFLYVHPLHFSPGAAAGVQQAAQALRQRGKTLDTGHSSRRTVR